MKRVQWIDTIKYICIMMVMLSHLDAATPFLGAIYGPVYVTGFFFAAGYTYKHKVNFGAFLRKKTKVLFLPWLYFSVLNILLSHVISFNKHETLWEELKWNFLQIREKGDGLWFVAALFVAFIPFFYWVDMYEKFSKSYARTLCVFVALVLAVISQLYARLANPSWFPWGSVALPWHIEYIFVGMAWMIIGYLFGREFEEKYDSISIYVKLSSIIVFLVMRFTLYYSGLIFTSNIFDLTYSCLASCCGLFALIFISKSISPNNYMLYIGGNTLICFALHGKLYSVIQTLFELGAGEFYRTMLSNELYSSILGILIAFTLSVILIIPIYIINRWFPFLVGRKYN